MITSIENFTSWSWSGIFTNMIPYLDLPVSRIVRGPNIEDVEVSTDTEILLLQNVDSLNIKGNKARTVCRIGGIGLEREQDVLNGTKWDYPLSQVGAVIATNPLLATYGAMHNRNTHMIPNGLDLSLFTPNWERRPGKMFRVGFVGNISTSFYLTYKGFHFVAGACSELFDQTEMITALYKSRQLPHEKMISDFYDKVDCVVNMSLGEGCSNTIMEALACGVPVICTKVGYHGAKLRDGYNCLFVPRDAPALRDAILKLANNVHLWQVIRKNGREFAEANHDIRKIAKSYNEVFKTLLGKEITNG